MLEVSDQIRRHRERGNLHSEAIRKHELRKSLGMPITKWIVNLEKNEAISGKYRLPFERTISGSFELYFGPMHFYIGGDDWIDDAIAAINETLNYYRLKPVGWITLAKRIKRFKALHRKISNVTDPS